jgi:hypothetical protein
VTAEEELGKVSVPVQTIYKEQLSDLYAKGCDMVIEIPNYDKVKARLCKEWPKGLGNEQNTEDSSKIVFSEEVLRQANNSSFLRIDQTDDSAKRIPVFAGEDCEYLLRNRTFFLDGTFKNCSVHLYLVSTSHENYIFSVMFALLPD